jgi:hypothetical protein
VIRLTLRTAALTAKGQRYQAMWGERVVCTSRQPLFDAARVLALEGVPFDTVLEASHEGQPIVAMRSTVGEAAQWAVSESERGGISRYQWQPYENAVESAGPACWVLPQDAPPAHEGVPENAVQGEAA